MNRLQARDPRLISNRFNILLRAGNSEVTRRPFSGVFVPPSAVAEKQVRCYIPGPVELFGGGIRKDRADTRIVWTLKHGFEVYYVENNRNGFRSSITKVRLAVAPEIDEFKEEIARAAETNANIAAFLGRNQQLRLYQGQ